ncbi:MAG: sulfite exporter TauE/SafE family protein [Candidatus Aminicenantales bacterium]
MITALLVVVAIVAGLIASIVGFGVGSLLTPALSLETGIKLAVAAVAVPHMAGAAIRLWSLRGHVDSRVFLRFGIASAAGGLAGALLHRSAGGALMTGIFGVLLAFSGLGELTGWAGRIRFRGAGALAAGGLSGLLGGLVGNQGGIRSAALLGFDLSRERFVATATAIALLVDTVRLPVYLWTEGARMLEIWPLMAWMTAGVVIGTLVGRRLLDRIPERAFRRIVGAIVLLLGLYMLYRAIILLFPASLA